MEEAIGRRPPVGMEVFGAPMPAPASKSYRWSSASPREENMSLLGAGWVSIRYPLLLWRY